MRTSDRTKDARHRIAALLVGLFSVTCTSSPEVKDLGGDLTIEVPAADLAAHDSPGGENLKPDGAAEARPDHDKMAVPGSWILIAAGTFTMGSPETEPCRDDDEAQHQVTLSRAFMISRTEVTRSQFEAVIGNDPSTLPACGDCPVEGVTWHEAATYCNTLSALAGLDPCYACSSSMAGECDNSAAYMDDKIYDCPGYRLPTEAEWEFAYRAGTESAYYSGDNEPDKCTHCYQTQFDPNLDTIGWYCAHAGQAPHPVAQKVPNSWGLYDMAGNVLEWCHDWGQMELGTEAVTDPPGAATGQYRVCRGGSWAHGPKLARAAERGDLSPAYHNMFLGFRCVRTSPRR